MPRKLWRKARALLFRSRGEAVEHARQATTPCGHGRRADARPSGSRPALHLVAAAPSDRRAAPARPAELHYPRPLLAEEPPRPLSVRGRPGDARFTRGLAWISEGPKAGGCAAVWIGGLDGDPARAGDITLQIFDAGGGALPSDRVIARASAGLPPRRPRIAALAGGRVAVAWRDPADAPGLMRLAICGPDADSLAELRLDLGAVDAARAPEIEPLAISEGPDGAFACAWSVLDIAAPMRAPRGYAGRFDAGGARRGAPVATSADTALARIGPAAARVVAAWTTPDVQSEAGRPVSFAILAEDPPQDPPQDLPRAVAQGAARGVAAAGLSDGGFALAWEAVGANAARGRRFSADGVAIGPEFTLPAAALDAAPWGDGITLALAPDGRLAAQWVENDLPCSAPVRPDTVAALVRTQEC